jgi:hypothetical protein
MNSVFDTNAYLLNQSQQYDPTVAIAGDEYIEILLSDYTVGKPECSSSAASMTLMVSDTALLVKSPFDIITDLFNGTNDLHLLTQGVLYRVHVNIILQSCAYIKEPHAVKIDNKTMIQVEKPTFQFTHAKQCNGPLVTHYPTRLDTVIHEGLKMGSTVNYNSSPRITVKDKDGTPIAELTDIKLSDSEGAPAYMIHSKDEIVKMVRDHKLGLYPEIPKIKVSVTDVPPSGKDPGHVYLHITIPGKDTVTYTASTEEHEHQDTLDHATRIKRILDSAHG